MIGAGLLAMSVALSLPAQVELRGERAPVEGAIVGLGVDGVEVDGLGVISWDRVRDIDGEWEEIFERDFREYADKAWRARTRLERGDTILAEPLFEELFATYGFRRSALAGVVSEGLLRCRLRRDAQALAVEAWLSLLASGASSPLLDRETGLVPTLAPIWLPSDSVAVVRVVPPENGDDHLLRLADWYAAAADFEAGREAHLPPRESADRGLALVADIVSGRAGDETTRRKARQSLRTRARAHEGTWIEAWALAGLGRSLIREGEIDQVREGVVYLLSVAARFSRQTPYLCGVCLAEAAGALEAVLGDTNGARAVAQELARRYPEHPALGWEPIRDLVRHTRPIARGDR